jgi:hypothetical protein
VKNYLEKVRQELAHYEHPLFTFDARENGDAIDVLIEFRAPEPAVHTYVYTLQPRDLENAQFPWTFQRQLYDCLHDYIVEMFTRNPQCKD